MPVSVRSSLRRVAYAALFLSLLILASGGGAFAADALSRSTASVTTASGGRFAFKVEVAVTEAEQARGLMYRERLADDAGMLFPYATPRPTAFWMRNTLIPLDMIFIDGYGRISKIHPMATPGSEATISSDGPVLAVLEIRGGLAARLGIRVGDRVGSPYIEIR